VSTGKAAVPADENTSYSALDRLEAAPAWRTADGAGSYDVYQGGVAVGSGRQGRPVRLQPQSCSYVADGGRAPTPDRARARGGGQRSATGPSQERAGRLTNGSTSRRHRQISPPKHVPQEAPQSQRAQDRVSAQPHDGDGRRGNSLQTKQSDCLFAANQDHQAPPAGVRDTENRHMTTRRTRRTGEPSDAIMDLLGGNSSKDATSTSVALFASKAPRHDFNVTFVITARRCPPDPASNLQRSKRWTFLTTLRRLELFDRTPKTACGTQNGRGHRPWMRARTPTRRPAPRS